MIVMMGDNGYDVVDDIDGDGYYDGGCGYDGYDADSDSDCDSVDDNDVGRLKDDDDAMML